MCWGKPLFRDITPPTMSTETTSTTLVADGPNETWKQIAAGKVLKRDLNLIDEWKIPADVLADLEERTDVHDFPETSGLLTDKELEITSSTAPEVAAKIKSKQWTAYEVTKAFCHRSQIAHQLTNCLTEIFYKEAMEQAKELDEYYESTGKLKGSFHGVPISLKDNINVIGKGSSIGFVAWSVEPETFTYDSAIAELMRREGAVFYAKTNVPVAMMMPESVNHVYGATSNPYNRDLSAGGSSGGSGAHAALRGSIVDIGSDIGGSVRIPASFNGLYSVRPTSGRYPTFGTRSGLPGLESVSSVNGPLCSDIDSMEWYLKTLVGADPSTVDPKVAYMPWREVSLPKKLRFAVLIDDGFVKPTPPIIRGVTHVAELLKDAGHDVIEWDGGEIQSQLAEIVGQLFVSDGGRHVLETVGKTGEPLFPYMENYGTSPDINVSDLWKLHVERTQLAKKFLEKWMATVDEDGRPIDALILPATPHAGCPHGKFGNYVGYTSFVNALDYSAGTVPVTRVDKLVDKKDTTHEPRNEIDAYFHEHYDGDVSHGGPVSVQIVCRKYEEEKVVEIMKVISKLITTWSP